jgi:hypothetical protein
LLSMVPFLCAIPALFHELAHSKLLHADAGSAVDVVLGASELLPMVAILPFMLYQLAGFGTLHFIVPRSVNWAINLGILGLIIASYIAYRDADYGLEKRFDGILVVFMALTVLYGVLKLKRMQTIYDTQVPTKTQKQAA